MCGIDKSQSCNRYQRFWYRNVFQVTLGNFGFWTPIVLADLCRFCQAEYFFIRNLWHIPKKSNSGQLWFLVLAPSGTHDLF